MQHARNRTSSRRRPARSGAALLICIFVAAICSLIGVSMIDAQRLHLKALRHTLEYERAEYLAGAGVHHALALMENSEDEFEDFSIGPIEFPNGSGDTYQAEATRVDDTFTVEGTGTSGGVSRHLLVTVVPE